MTQEEAKELLHTMLMGAMKAKSNLIEALGDDEAGRLVCQITEPKLFPEPGRLGLIEALSKMESKTVLEWQDVANALYLADKSPGTQFTCITLWGVELPKPLDILPGWFEK